MNDFKTNLKEFLTNNIPGKVVAGNKEFLCRCPFCGDSRHLKSAHFYINLPNSDDTPVMYHCKKCNVSGILNRNILRELGVEVIDGDVLSDLISRHKKLSGNFIRGSNKNKSLYKFNTNYDRISISEMSELKMKYINDRLGLKLSYQEMIDCKIILNLLDLFNDERNNYYLHYTRDKRIIQELNDSFIGFLGYNNGVINMRNLRPGKVSKYVDKRYVNYNLFPTEYLEGTSKYYIIPTIVDTLNPEPVKIHIAEGPFDILSIFYNLYNGNKYNSIYASIGGKSYINLIKFLLCDLKIINAEIHIYFDNDVKDKEIQEIIYQLQYLNLDIYAHWNRFEDEKDYGVPKSKILDYREQIIKKL